jgi:hypothetical protein
MVCGLKFCFSLEHLFGVSPAPPSTDPSAGLVGIARDSTSLFAILHNATCCQEMDRVCSVEREELATNQSLKWFFGLGHLGWFGHFGRYLWLLLCPGLCYLYAALCLLLWPELCGSSMVWTMHLPMLASMIHLWATIGGKSFPVTNSLSLVINHD